MKGRVPVDGNMLRLFYPNWVFLHAHAPSWLEWPLWNPYRNMGEPFWADPQSMAAYPPAWLFFRLPNHLTFMRCWILAHTALAAGFAGVWLWRRTQDSAAAIAAALLAAFNGYFMSHATLPNHFAAAAYVPVIIFYFFDEGKTAGLAVSFWRFSG